MCNECGCNATNFTLMRKEWETEKTDCGCKHKGEATPTTTDTVTIEKALPKQAGAPPGPDAVETGLKIGNPSNIAGSSVHLAESDKGAVKPLDADAKKLIEYPGGNNDRTEASANHDTATGKRPSGYFHSGLDALEEIVASNKKKSLQKCGEDFADDVKLVHTILDALLEHNREEMGDLVGGTVLPDGSAFSVIELPDVASDPPVIDLIEKEPAKPDEKEGEEKVEEEREEVKDISDLAEILKSIDLAKNWVPHTSQNGQPAAKNTASGDIKYGEEAKRLLSGFGRGTQAGASAARASVQPDQKVGEGTDRMMQANQGAQRAAMGRQTAQEQGPPQPATDALNAVASNADTYQQASTHHRGQSLPDAMQSNGAFRQGGGKLHTEQPLHPDYISDDEVQAEIAAERQRKNPASMQQVGDLPWESGPIQQNDSIPATMHDAQNAGARGLNSGPTPSHDPGAVDMNGPPQSDIGADSAKFNQALSGMGIDPNQPPEEIMRQIQRLQGTPPPPAPTDPNDASYRDMMAAPIGQFTGVGRRPEGPPPEPQAITPGEDAGTPTPPPSKINSPTSAAQGEQMHQGAAESQPQPGGKPPAPAGAKKPAPPKKPGEEDAEKKPFGKSCSGCNTIAKGFFTHAYPEGVHGAEFEAVLKAHEGCVVDAHLLAFVKGGSAADGNVKDCIVCSKLKARYDEPKHYFIVMKQALLTGRVARFGLTPKDQRFFDREFPALKQFAGELLQSR